MKKILGGLVISALLAAPAMAADMRMPVKAAPAPIVTVFSWTGCYIGGHVGYAWGKKRSIRPASRVPALASITISTASSPAVRSAAISGSATAGCSASKARPPGLTWTARVGPHFTAAAYNGFKTEADIIGSIAARLGYAFGATGQTLVFVKGGAAFIHEQFFANYGGVPTALFTSDKDLRWGWMVGAGFEQALNSNWSLKAEYNYSNFGTDDIGSVSLVPPASISTSSSTSTWSRSASTTASAAPGCRPLLIG